MKAPSILFALNHIGRVIAIPLPLRYHLSIHRMDTVLQIAGLRNFILGAVLSLLLASAPRASDYSVGPIDWENEREFWSFQIPRPHSLPQVQASAWPERRIDYFILSRLEAEQLAPSTPASKRTLIRRLSFDITGLPPSPAEVEAFLEDAAPDAYDRLVERLLSSPRFGERLTSMWLPLARYAEDQAHQVGNDTKYFYPNAYKYREWVINAFNRDLAYDQFLKLQLAADAYEASPEDLAALGFIGLGPKYYNRNRLEVLVTEYEDRVDTVTRAMLGLTVACARCHDHKFEPITMEDYYAMAGVFAGTKLVNKPPGGDPEKKDTSADKMSADTLHMVEDAGATNLNIFIRGDVGRKGPMVERRFLRVLSEGEPDPFSEETSGRRELAEAIASPANPLTARVFVNRVWGEFFGQPLVSTPSNFGHSGELPTHPDLLDDLAARFVQNGWSTKWLVREIVLSSAYRQTSDPENPGRAATIDPANQLLWKMNRKRLTIEQWRDSILYVSGELDHEGGKSLELADPENHRRTVYARISRLKLDDTLMQFDYPDANVHAEQRFPTTTPMQKLFVLNNPFMLQRASAVAKRLEQEAPESAAERISHGYRLLFSREPISTEIQLGLDFLREAGDSQETAWPQYAQVLLGSNEMIYVD